MLAFRISRLWTTGVYLFGKTSCWTKLIATFRRVSNQQSRLETARMPWHDVHMTLVGPVVMDSASPLLWPFELSRADDPFPRTVAQHYVERWNFIRSMKYKHDSRYEHLAFPHVVGENDNPIQSIVRHPHLHAWKVRSLPPLDRVESDPGYSKRIGGRQGVHIARTWTGGGRKGPARWTRTEGQHARPVPAIICRLELGHLDRAQYSKRLLSDDL